MTERDYKAEFRKTILDYAKRNPEGMADMYVSLREELTKPPEGWFNFGTHILPEHHDIKLEWWGTGDDGMPMWERPVEEHAPWCASKRTCNCKPLGPRSATPEFVREMALEATLNEFEESEGDT